MIKVIPNTMRRKISPSKTSVKTNIRKSVNTRVAFPINVRDMKLHLSCKRYTIQPLSLQLPRHEIKTNKESHFIQRLNQPLEYAILIAYITTKSST